MIDLFEIDEMLKARKRIAQQSPYLNIVELAERLNVSVRTIRRRQREGSLPPRVRQSRKLVYRKADLVELLGATVIAG